MLLWWAIVRQAARDVVLARSKVTAEEALEFLTVSGGMLCRLFFGVPPVAFKAAVERLVEMSRTLGNGR